MILKDEYYFNNNLRLGEDIVVQIMKEQLGKKGPTVTRNIILDYENIKIYPYNRDHVVFEKKFNFGTVCYITLHSVIPEIEILCVSLKKMTHCAN